MINMGNFRAQETPNGQEQISYSQFCMAAMNSTVLINEEKVYRAFNLFDTDESGGISKDEIRFILNFLDSLSDEEIDKMIAFGNWDEDGDNLSYEEFFRLIQYFEEQMVNSA